MGEHRRLRALAGLALTAILAAAVGVGTAGCGRGGAAAGQDGPGVQGSLRLPVEVVAARRGTVEVALEFSGRVVPSSEVRVAAKAAGRVELVLVDVGDRVAAGQVLALLEDGGARARLREAEAVLALARSNRQRMEELYAEGAVARQVLDQAQLEEARAQVAVDLAREGVEAARVVAPVSGEVAARLAHPGDLAAPGTPVVTLIDPRQLFVEGSLAETQVAQVRPGSQARVEVGGRELDGVVEWVAPAGEGQGRAFPVKVALRDPVGVRPGMTARVRVRLRGGSAAVVVPRAALVEAGQGLGVYVVASERASWRPVQTGLDDGQRVEVLEGLQPGELVIVAGQAYVQDGSPVDPRPAAGERPGAGERP